MGDIGYVGKFIESGMKTLLVGGAIVGVVAGAAVCGIPGYHFGKKKGIENTRNHVAELRLSERKVSEFPYEHQREEVFIRQVVPTFGLQRGTHEYNALERACVTGVLGSDAKDFSIDLKSVKSTYELCGWKLPEKK